MEVYTTKTLTSLKDKIEKLDKMKQIKILSILKENEKDMEFNENKSGVLINLINLQPNTLNEIVKYVENIQQQENYFNDFENKKEEFRKILDDKTNLQKND